jgi:hypothetical protein
MKNTMPKQLEHKKLHRVGLAALLLCFSLLTVLAAIVVVRTHGPGSPRALSSAVQQASQQLGLDPNQLEDPATYDTRPCVHAPSDATCSGKYPVSPQHVEPVFAVPHGAGACIDRASKFVENQPITDTNGHAVGTLQLLWMPPCRSYYGYVSFNFPLDQVAQAEIWVQKESTNGFVQWFDNFSQLPPTVTGTQTTGPVAGSALTNQELYSPLIYAPTDPVSAHIDIQLADGAEFGDGTSSFANGVFQY